MLTLDQIKIKCRHNHSIRYVLKFDDRRKMAYYEGHLEDHGFIWSNAYKDYFSNYRGMKFSAYLIGYTLGNVFFTYTIVGTPKVRDTRLLHIEDVIGFKFIDKIFDEIMDIGQL